jgi:Site-specific recombinase XerD
MEDEPNLPVPLTQAPPSIRQSINLFLESLETSSSEKTIRTYRTALRAFSAMLISRGINTEIALPSRLGVVDATAFITFLKTKAPSTEKIYLTAMNSYFAFLEDEELAAPNLGKIRRRVQNRSRKSSWTPEVFPREQIKTLIDYAISLAGLPVEDAVTGLKSEKAIRRARQQAICRNLRDRALILVLADTGLRVAEACSLTYGQVDALEARLRDVQRKGYKRKGDREGSVVMISERALAAIRDYQTARKEEALPAGMKQKTVPLFVRHDRGSAGRMEALTEKSAWEIIKRRAREVLGNEAAEQIHPHSFRHYFVTVVLLETDLETARRLAGHASVSTTSRYAEIDPEVEERYYRIFNSKPET